uniref:cDNA FLJ25696 fis, clone TST04563 n=1 Tax=Homo sapiens TaxID=9606 RepID=Q8N7F3_HUMAN|nr:unnamed protein product [Homo sapiens]
MAARFQRRFWGREQGVAQGKKWSVESVGLMGTWFAHFENHNGEIITQIYYFFHLKTSWGPSSCTLALQGRIGRSLGGPAPLKDHLPHLSHSSLARPHTKETRLAPPTPTPDSVGGYQQKLNL